MSENEKIYDFDLINFYEPVSKDIYNTYLNSDLDPSFLSAQVTPIFPLFLNIFNSRKISLLICLFLIFTIIVLVYYIVNRISSHEIAILATLMLSFEPSFFALTYHLSPEILFSFFLVVGFYFLICQPFSNDKINYLLQATCLGLSALIRPIILPALLILSIFWMYHYLKKLQQIYLIQTVALLLPSAIWSYRNLQKHGFFNLSSISSNNLLIYEGVPALAEDTGLTFEQAKGIELKMRLQELGVSPSISEQYQYNNRRGLELVFNHPKGWFESHLKGTGKVLFGIFKSKHFIILKDLYKIENSLLLVAIFVAFGIMVLIIWLFFIVGLSQLNGLDIKVKASLIIILSMTIMPATGQIAYARFRSPVVPLICIIAALGINKIIVKNWLK
jgi:4-amino-4-deoxy-L-arabinose transferase-like glycosyltransferase